MKKKSIDETKDWTKEDKQLGNEETDDTDFLAGIIAVVLGVIFIAWIIFITPAIINTLFWKP